jgi:hypothetical protein
LALVLSANACFRKLTKLRFGNALSKRIIKERFCVIIDGRRRWSTLGLALILFISPLSNSAYSSSDKKRAKAYRDINAIGHRVIGYPSGYGNWYSLDKEKEIGAQVSAAFEKSSTLLDDSITQAYLDRLAQTIALNSDSQES